MYARRSEPSSRKMARMVSEPSRYGLLVNDKDGDHASAIGLELRVADQFVGMVGFAKWSASRDFLGPLEAALARGMVGKLAVGLSLYLTDPKLLWELLRLSNTYGNMAVFISRLNDAGRTDTTFHPKIYAFRGATGHTVMVGSSNMTRGGLKDNHEASLVVSEPAPTTFLAVTSLLDSLVKQRELIKITSACVDRYEQLHKIHGRCRREAEKKAGELTKREAPQLSDLREKLGRMRRDRSEHGMNDQMRDRTAGSARARHIVKQWASEGRQERSFLEQYEQLLRCFHSAGLLRGKTKVNTRPRTFVALLRQLTEIKRLSPEFAYDLLNEFIRKIPGTGPNLLTELLHSADPTRFAVMNRRSVSVLRSTGAPNMPQQLNKNSIDGSDYASFCKAARKIRVDLGLADFTELDALLNYAYEDLDN